MANNNLHSVIRINGTDYDITAKKVDNSLTIKAGSSEITFDGSEARNLEFAAGDNIAITANEENKITISATGGGNGGTSETASKIKVTMDDGATKDATITIKSSDPTGGVVGDIWFKY